MSTDAYSYSKIDTYQQCPFKFKLTYVDGHYVHGDSISTEVGTAIHGCEEKIAIAIRDGTPIEYIKLKNELLLKMVEFEHKYKAEWTTPDKSGRTFPEKLYAYLEVGIYRLEEFMKANPILEIVGIEQGFKFDYKNGRSFKGFIDRVFRDKATGKYLVQDIKTYPVEVAADKLATPLQFVIYALAVKNLYGCDLADVSCQYYLPFCDVAQDAGTPGYIARGEAKIDKLFTKIDEGDWKPSPTPLCNWCQFCKTNPDATDESKFLCPYFSHWDRVTRNRHDISNVENKWAGIEAHEAIMEAYLRANSQNAE